MAKADRVSFLREHKKLDDLLPKDAYFDIDHDEKGRRKYLLVSNIIDHVINKKSLEYLFRFFLHF